MGPAPARIGAFAPPGGLPRRFVLVEMPACATCVDGYHAKV